MLVSSFPSYTRGGPMPLAGAPRDLYTQLLACSSSQSVVAIACCLRASLCFGFCLLAVSDCTMTTRWTNNSLAASSDRENLPSDTLLQAQLSVPSLPASAANSVPQSSSTVSAPVVAASVDEPALITIIVDAVKASLAAERGPGSTSSNLRRNSVSMELQAASGGIPAPSPSLSQQTANFLASGGAFPEQQAISLPSATQGTPNFTVPSFVATFTTPHSLTLRTSITAGVSVPVPLSDSSLVTSLPSGLLLQQPFVVGPGFSPIPVKTVSQIVAGKYVDSGELPSVNILQTKPESEAFLDVHLVFLPSTKKQRRRTEDIVTWSEAFTIFMLILTSYFPHCWKDLTSYKLLILCTYRQFSGRVEMAGIRSGLPPASCGDEARRLVDRKDSTLQFSCWWGLCAFWVWWFLERATWTIWSWLLPGHLPVVEEGPLFGTVCFVLGYPSLQHLCGFSPCVGMLKSFWQNIFARSQTQICFSSLHTFAHLEKQALVDVPCCFPDCFFCLVDLLWLPLVFLPDSWPLVSCVTSFL